MADVAADEEAERALRRAFGAFATGVAVVAAQREGGAVAGITVNSFASVSLAPPLVLWCLDKACARYELFAAAELWGVSVLGAADEALALRFTRADTDAIDPKQRLHLGGAPMHKAGVAHFACRSFDRREAGDHLVILGEVADFRVRSGPALTFFRGRYGAAPEPEGG